MKMKKMLAAATAVAALTFATPALAQSTGGVTEGGDGSADDNLSINDSLNDVLDLLSNNALGNGDNRDNSTGSNHDSVLGSNLASIVGSNLGSVIGSNLIKAKQTQVAVINNSDRVVSFDGKDSTDYASGDNILGGSAFAAFAGINNLTQNTGINNINQTGVNVAAQGTVNLGGTPN